MSSPLQMLFAAVIAQDEAQRAIDFASLSAKAEHAGTYRDAQGWAEQCLDSRGGWDFESLSFNLESNFAELSMEEIEDIAESALAKRAR